jgi:cation diffusion facilitator family transporter
MTARESRRSSIARILWIILGLNLAVAAAKLVYGQVHGVLAISADGLHSLLDATSNVVGLVGAQLARRPPDANHPYGHRKYETFAALAIAALLLLGSREIAVQAFERLRSLRPPEIRADAFAVLIATLVVNVIVVAVERREGRRLQSELLQADASHTLSDVYATLLVIGSLVAGRLGVAWADVAAALVVLVLVLRAGIGIVRGTFSTLSDERRIPPDSVEQVALEEPGVLEAHNVRSRGPLDDVHLDLHVLVAPDTRIADAHRVGHRVEERLRGRFPGLTDVVVHVEPGLESERATRRKGGGLQAES